jgi:hypothetical protein
VETIPEQLRGIELLEKVAEQVSAGSVVDSGKKDKLNEKNTEGGDDSNEEQIPAKKPKIEGEFRF